jgi:hypothetical protein
MSGHTAKPFVWIALVVLISGANVAVLANPARADDCRPGPNAPAPPGNHWYYRLDWPTQRKCWYVRAPGRHMHQATAGSVVMPATASPQASAASDPTPGTDAAAVSSSLGDGIPASPQAKTAALKPIAASASGGTIDKSPRQGALEESTMRTEDAPVPQAGTLLEAGGQTAASPMLAPPDQPNPVASARPQEYAANPARTRADVMLDEADNSARSSGPINNGATPMIIFPLLALGLALLGIGSRFLVKHGVSRRAWTIIREAEFGRMNHQGWREGRDDVHRQDSVVRQQELNSFISAVSDQGASRADGDAVRITREIGKRRHRLAQLRQNIEWMLRSTAEPRTTAMKA